MAYEQYKNKLQEIIKFKSISTDKKYLPEIQKTVDWLKNLFEQSKFNVEVWKGNSCNPIVFATYEDPSNNKTVLVYGHYDVQPAEKEDGWTADPFSLTEKDGRLYARGVVDNKGQFLIHVYTVIELIKQGKLKYNVKFLLEGNEETSNEDLGKLLIENRAKLQTDYIIVSDGEVASDKPTIEYSLRGGFNSKLIFKTANNNLHSGLYGGAAPNAAYELSMFVAKLFNKDNQINVPGFYDDVDEITDSQRENNLMISEGMRELLENLGISKFVPEPDMDLYSQVGLRPTIQVTGYKSGYIDQGYSNIVPATAEVRLNFRTVVSQNNQKIIDLFKKFLEENVPEYVEFEFVTTTPYDPIKVDISDPMIEKVKGLLTEAYGDEVMIKPVGGGIPVVSDFKEVLGKDTLLVSLGNEDCNMHGVDENFTVALIKKGLRFSELFFGGS